MNTTPADQHVYVIQLHTQPGGELRGRLEHVLSGRRHDFDNGPALLACLAHEQAQVALATARPPRRR